jgi:hypothetical protein
MRKANGRLVSILQGKVTMLILVKSSELAVLVTGNISSETYIG